VRLPLRPSVPSSPARDELLAHEASVTTEAVVALVAEGPR
jgi:hypothetical protein